MTDLLNIGKSGMLAYRTALTVTSENVANADTEGYSRRSIVTKEAAGTATNPYANSMTGQGVLIDDVRRAFNSLVINQVRETGSAVASAETMLPAMEQLEDRMLPEAGGITSMLDGFFEAIEGLSATPSDRGMRSVLIESGGGLATAVSDLASDVSNLGDYLHAQGGQVVDRINGLLSEMYKLQEKIGYSSVPGADNAALDRRDKLLTDLSELIEVNVSYSDSGVATVRMGDSVGGPILLDPNGAARITLNADLSLNVRPYQAASDPELTLTRSASGGQLHGLGSALGALNATLTDLNEWAQTLADQMNTIHGASRDADGNQGVRMFSLNGWDADPAAANQGTSLATATEIEGEEFPSGRIRLIRDNTAGVWNAYDESNTLLGTGTNLITLTGVTIEITGNGAEGDIIDLEPTHGDAKNLTFLLDDPDQIASGGAMTVTASTANTGTATLSAAPDDTAFAYMAEVADILPTDGTAVDLLSSGVVGLIPAGTSEVTLASLSVGGGSPSDLMVFTREGTQIAGPGMSAAAAAALLTTGNGFADGAVYDGSLTGASDNYLGTQLSTDGTDANTNWLRLTNLPAEDLIVVAGAGALEIGGVITQGDGTNNADRTVTLNVVDSASGEVELLDQATGHRLGGGILDANGEVSIAGTTIQLSGTIQDGDEFDITASASGTGDARGLLALAALRSFDSSSGLGGFQSLMTEIRTEVGGTVAATEARLEVSQAQYETAVTAHSASSGVDLDTEAAALMKYQQAYQANARIMTVARELFSTLLNSL
ncbi:MAG: flagellar hook-associated protein FlgK [Thalassovita sp.]